MRGAWWIGAGLIALASCVAEGQDTGSAQLVSAPSTSLRQATEPAPPTSTTLPLADSSARAEREPIVLGFAGDTNFVGWTEGSNPLAGVADLLAAPDLMVVNLETVIADPEVGSPPVEKAYLFKSPPASLSALTGAGVDVVALGNNHTLDFGHDGVAQTLSEIDEADLARVGAGLDEAEAYTPLVVEVGEWKIGLVSLSRVPCDWSEGGANVRPEVAWACPPFLGLADAAVATAATETDLVVVMIHGGTEGVMCPAEEMVKLRQHFSELGVDLMVDGHPHVVQGITSYGEMLVINSTGNFSFPAAQSVSANSAIFNVELSEVGLALRVEPIWAPGGIAQRPSEAQYGAIIAQINAFSDGWQLDAEGVARPDSSAKSPC